MFIIFVIRRTFNILLQEIQILTEDLFRINDQPSGRPGDSNHYAKMPCREDQGLITLQKKPVQREGRRRNQICQKEGSLEEIKNSIRERSKPVQKD